MKIYEVIEVVEKALGLSKKAVDRLKTDLEIKNNSLITKIEDNEEIVEDKEIGDVSYLVVSYKTLSKDLIDKCSISWVGNEEFGVIRAFDELNWQLYLGYGKVMIIDMSKID